MNRKGECEYCGLYLGSRPYAGKGIASTTELIGLLNFDEKARKFAWNGAWHAACLGVHGTDRWAGKLPTQVPKAEASAWAKAHKVSPIPEVTYPAPCSQDPHVFPGLCKACRFLRSEFDRKWKEKSSLGEHVHHLAASWANGDDVTSDEVVDPFLDGLEAWYKLYEPSFVAVEQTIYYHVGPREFVGTFDLLYEHNCPCPLADERARCLSLSDIKTGDFKADKDWLLQLSSYRYAESRTRWEDGKQVVTGPMPKNVAHTSVLWLHGDRPAEMVEVHTNHESFNNFLRLVDLHNWEKGVDKEMAELKYEAEVEAQIEALEEDANAQV